MSIAEHMAQRPIWDGHERRQLRDPHYEGPERRHGPASNDPRIVDLRLRMLEQQSADWAEMARRIDERFAAGSRRMDGLQGQLTAMSGDLQANTTVTTEVRDILTLGKNGFKVLGWLGSGVIWTAKAVGALSAAGLAVYSAWYAFAHGGTLPPKAPIPLMPATDPRRHPAAPSAPLIFPPTQGQP